MPHGKNRGVTAKPGVGKTLRRKKEAITGLKILKKTGQRGGGYRGASSDCKGVRPGII